MSYAIRKDGQGWRSVNSKDDVGNDETYSETQPGPIEPTANQLVISQIAELEATVTDRRVREAVLGVDGGWLKSLNDQIAGLRAKLVP